jgi:siderophore synthetase component
MYCRILLQGPVEFYARWGLAFEPHLQNAMIRIQGGWPIALILRDLDATILDSTRIPQKLRDNGLCLPAEQWEAMPTFEHGAQRLANALLFLHLSQVMLYLVNQVGLEFTELWDSVERAWSELLHSNSGAVRDRIAELRVHSESVKCLLTMRMEHSSDALFTTSHTSSTR